MFKIIVTFLISVTLSNVYGAIPEYIHVCKRNDPKIADCIKSSIIHLRDKIATGIPELQVPGVEPLRIPRLEMQDNANMNLTDLVIKGPSDFELKDLTVDIDKNRFAFLYVFKELTFSGNYDIDMQILRIPIKSSGPMTGSFQNFQMTGKMAGRKINKNGSTYLKFRPVELKFFQGKSQLRLENLFQQQRALETAANDFINQNNEMLIKEILPALEKTLGEHFTTVANQITSHFTYDELFPLN